MSKFQRKAEAQTKQIIGQMLGDELLVQEGREQQREATETEPSVAGQNKERDQGIVRDERGQEQPRDKERAQRVSRVDQRRRSAWKEGAPQARLDVVRRERKAR